jgi:hypothetical protein
VKNDYGTEQEAWALNGLEELLKKHVIEMGLPFAYRSLLFTPCYFFFISLQWLFRSIQGPGLLFSSVIIFHRR